MAFSIKAVFSKVDSLAHTFVKYAAGALSWFKKEEPVIADVWHTGMAYVEPLVVDLIDIEFGPAVGAEATKAINAVGNELTALKSLVFDWGVTGGAVAKAQSVLGDLQNLETAGYIKSDKGKSVFSRIVQEITALITGYQAVQGAQSTQGAQGTAQATS